MGVGGGLLDPKQALGLVTAFPLLHPPLKKRVFSPQPGRSSGDLPGCGDLPGKKTGFSTAVSTQINHTPLRIAEKNKKAMRKI